MEDMSGSPRKMSNSSSASRDTASSLDVGEIVEVPDEESRSISAILHFCKCKILRPYLRLLSTVGLRPLPLDPPEPRSCLALLSYVHLAQVLVLVCLGYLLQYMACFRRDRGFYRRACHGSVAWSYVVPGALHLAGSLYAACLFRLNENEQLKNLMERAFLLSDGCAGQRRLVYRLWLFVALGILWMLLSLVTVTVMMNRGTVTFQWFEHSSQEVKTVMKVLLTVATLWHDMVQATVISSYCLQGQLLTSHLQFLREKLIQHTILPLDWIREVGEFRKLLRYLNEDLAPGVCIFTVVNVSWATSGTVWLLQYDSVEKNPLPVVGIGVLNVLLWVSISLAPFLQAACLTSACSAMQSVGHEVRGRPFVYRDTPAEDLDTILLYTSSLRMSARLFRVPVTGRYLCLALTLGAVVVLTLGQCHIL